MKNREIENEIYVTTNKTYSSTIEDIRMKKGQEIINSIKEKRSSSSLVADPNWLSFPTPMNNGKVIFDKFCEALDDDNKVIANFIKIVKSNPKNAHQKVLREQKIRDALEENEISYLVAERILEEVEAEQINTMS